MARRKNVDHTNSMYGSGSVADSESKEQVHLFITAESSSVQFSNINQTIVVPEVEFATITEARTENVQKESLSLVFEVLDTLTRKSSNVLFRQAVLDFKSLTSGKKIETSMSDNCAELKRFLTIFYRQSYDVQERLRLKKAISVIESMA
jgi:hypothetical protein